MAGVDAHVHVFRRASAEYPRPVDRSLPEEREALVEHLLRVMREAAITHAVLVALSEHDAYVSECLQRYPETFAGVLVHDRRVADPVSDIVARLDDSGADGVRFYDLDFDVLPLFECLRERDAKLWMYISERDYPRLDAALERCPELTVVLNHLGFPKDAVEIDERGLPQLTCPLPPPTLPRVLEFARFPNVYVHFSGLYAASRVGYPYNDLRSTVEALLETFGPDRLMWASDYPFVADEPGYLRTVDLVDHHFADLSADERTAIMGETCARLFGFMSRDGAA